MACTGGRGGRFFGPLGRKKRGKKLKHTPFFGGGGDFIKISLFSKGGPLCDRRGDSFFGESSPLSRRGGRGRGAEDAHKVKKSGKKLKKCDTRSLRGKLACTGGRGGRFFGPLGRKKRGKTMLRGFGGCFLLKHELDVQNKSRTY